uniref:RNase H type-1 domain-containing protein n=1 Tax=Cannabis sativa TaxID=3483 RepID=A0A803Q9W5_CANSA
MHGNPLGMPYSLASTLNRGGKTLVSLSIFDKHNKCPMVITFSTFRLCVLNLILSLLYAQCGLYGQVETRTYMVVQVRMTAAPTATSSSNSHNVTAVRWQPPIGMGLKINIDAVVNSAAKKLGVGAIVRDHGGHVVAALSKSVQGCFRSDEKEAKALFHSLNWVLQHQISITNIETDALRVFQALTSTSTDLSSF